MKTISLTQPWASLVACGAKRAETRSFQVSHRGELAIHASKGFPRWAKDISKTPGFSLALTGESLPLGAVIATCRIVDCVRTECLFVVPPTQLIGGWRLHGPGCFAISEQEKMFGDYSPGRWAWLLANIEPLPEPIPTRGALSLWNWEPPA
jgi:hypothetical protein